MPRTTASAGTARMAAQAIRAARAELGVTQAELARRLGTSAPYITSVEAGRENLTLGQLTNIANALDAGLEIRLVVMPPQPVEVPDALDAAPMGS